MVDTQEHFSSPIVNKSTGDYIKEAHRDTAAGVPKDLPRNNEAIEARRRALEPWTDGFSSLTDVNTALFQDPYVSREADKSQKVYPFREKNGTIDRASTPVPSNDRYNMHKSQTPEIHRVQAQNTEHHVSFKDRILNLVRRVKDVQLPTPTPRGSGMQEPAS